MKSLYERLGGEAAVAASVVRFYEKIMADATLAPFFDGLELPKQIDKQVAFMTMAFGGPNNYSGQDLRRVHAPLVRRGLGNAHFDAVAGHLIATLQELGVSEALINEVVAIVGTTRADVLSQ